MPSDQTQNGIEDRKRQEQMREDPRPCERPQHQRNKSDSIEDRCGDDLSTAFVTTIGLCWRLPVGRPLAASRGETTS